MSTLVVIAALVAGSLGAVIRYGTARAFAAHPARLPWAVLIVNVAPNRPWRMSPLHHSP